MQHIGQLGSATVDVDYFCESPLCISSAAFDLMIFLFLQLLILNKETLAWPFVLHLNTPNAIN